ncbi:hypothetical protein [Nostoc sp. 'Peltigera membranacea cyanobiont' N6]|uniref:hypothetical protein n=1 Tax=Nostoc sp. 'Peltigera membranacea cyanobiont' N6 TaxID=1261031 RepID=UPI000CF315F4|nr:hypothetical protein [Nostoc sp. 'Peltigera membranacea cyanobiont' N6]AVH65595.1 hypothetical protein NPM_4039 [Nostoc sp. 'Peltigera membranacea cyanobiont' N6]
MSTHIIAHLSPNGEKKDTSYRQDSFESPLACGNTWKHSLAEYLKTQGLDNVYHLDQYMTHSAVYGSYKADPDNWRSRSQSKLAQDLYPKYQRDIRVIHRGKGYNIEVKSKSGIFGNHNILVGGIATRWERYRFPVHFVVAIDRATGEVRVTEADRLTRETSWLRIKAEELSYGVPRHLFKPLGSWLDFIKNQ